MNQVQRKLVEWNIREGAELIKALSSDHDPDSSPVVAILKNKNGSYGWAMDMDRISKERGEYEIIAALLAKLTGLKHEVCYGLLFEGKTDSLDSYRK